MGFCWPHLSPVGSSAWNQKMGSVLSRPARSSELEFVEVAEVTLRKNVKIHYIMKIPIDNW